MNIIDIIDKKRIKKKLTEEEITFFINGYLNGDVKDYQMSALLMAITINGMDLEETICLTDAMIKSGSSLDLSCLGDVIDKHSTGGVGDKTTLILGPIVASLGVKFAKMSGRGLGYTGGTIDKLEAIPNMKTALKTDDFIQQVEEIGIAITSQTSDIAKADKKLYALRDVTATVASIPLIASSIMSKKIASGASIIVIDVKVGNGALMKNENEAKKLAKVMIEIGKHYDRKVVCVLTNMDEPLGQAIGNALEVEESIHTLQGKGPEDLNELVIKLAAIILGLDQNINVVEAIHMVKQSISSGKAYLKFQEFIKKQGGHLEEMEVASKVVSVKTAKTGFISHIDTVKLGELARDLGAGRLHKDDVINPKVGFVVTKKVGEYVTDNEELLKVYLDNKDINIGDLLDCFEISNTSGEKKSLILDIIDSL